MIEGWVAEPEVPRALCTGKLLWVWGAYAFAMVWLSHAMSAAGFAPAAVWAVAAVIGLALAFWMREI